MAGRPRKMVKRVEELEQDAMMLHCHIFEAMPQKYRDDPGDDAISRAWACAVLTAHDALDACLRLGDILRAKAGIVGRGPVGELMAELQADAKGKGENGP